MQKNFIEQKKLQRIFFIFFSLPFKNRNYIFSAHLFIALIGHLLVHDSTLEHAPAYTETNTAFPPQDKFNYLFIFAYINSFFIKKYSTSRY
jgi:hypothetical protein